MVFSTPSGGEFQFRRLVLGSVMWHSLWMPLQVRFWFHRARNPAQQWRAGRSVSLVGFFNISYSFGFCVSENVWVICRPWGARFPILRAWGARVAGTLQIKTLLFPTEIFHIECPFFGRFAGFVFFTPLYFRCISAHHLLLLLAPSGFRCCFSNRGP